MKNNKFEWALDVKRDGATSCVLLGKVPKGSLPDGNKYRFVLWVLFKQELNLKKIPPNYRVIYIDYASEEDIDKEISNTTLKSLTSLPDLFISNSILSYKTEVYNVILDKIQLQFETTQRARNTRKEEGFLSQTNTIKNLVDYLCGRLATQETLDSDKSAVAVVGAGPSLDNSLPVLKSIQDRVTIIAVDSTLAALKKNDITPDATVSIDAEKPAAQCLPADMEPGVLFLSSKSPTDWKETNSKRFYLAGNSLTEDWLQNHGFQKTKIRCTQNCGITAIHIALELGYSSIYLFGMDNAIDDDGSGHASNVNLEVSRGSGHNPSGNHPTVAGNYKEEVKTFLKPELYALNEMLSKKPDKYVVHNVIDRGAKIENSILIHPEEFKSDGIDCSKRDLQSSLSTGTTTPEEAQQFIRSRTRKIPPHLLRKLKTSVDQRDLIVNIFQDKDLSGLLGNLLLKHGPQLLEWNNLDTQEKQAISNEVHDSLSILIDL